MTPDFGPEYDSPRPDVRTGAGFEPNEGRYTEETGAEICLRLAAGWSLNAVCRDPDMPSKPTVLKWAERRPAFAAAMAEARARTADRAEAAPSRRLRKQLARLAERGRLAPDRPGIYSDAVAETVCRRIAHGEALADICRDPDMPSHVTVGAWARRSPAFAYMLDLAREQQAQVKLDLAWKIARDATPATVQLARLRIQTLRWQAARLSPRAFADRAPIPPRHVMESIREDGPEGYWAQQHPELAAKSQAAGDWD
ncbi:hypothetical protein [Phenylobacterium sp.]|jgi:hypothetical protein|uniref:terminase small subunit-like protein n=1 Tax=Phenylobacterium sp. TaxID=1871053 RepID=UPI002F3F77E1